MPATDLLRWLKENLNYLKFCTKTKTSVDFGASKARIAGLLMSLVSVSLVASLCHLVVKMILNVRLC